MGLVSLESLSEKYKILLFDTCAITHPNRVHKKEIYDVFRGCCSSFKRYIQENDNSKIVIPQEVYDELYNWKYEIGKTSNNVFCFGKNKGAKSTKKNKVILLKKKSVLNRKKSLLKYLNNKNLVLSFNEEELKVFDSLFLEFNFLKKKFNLTGADYPLIISAMTLFYKRIENHEKIAVISNDEGVFGAGEFILKKDDSLRKSLHYFHRQTFNGFERRYFI